MNNRYLQIPHPFRAGYSSGPPGQISISPPSFHVTADDAIAYLQGEMGRHPEWFFGHVGYCGETIATVTSEGVLRCDVTERPERASEAVESPRSDGRDENGLD